MIKDKTENLLCIILACCAIISAFIGLFYSTGGAEFFVNNVYGQQVKLYGDGIYAYNSLFIYYFACLTFGISMNRLYLLYVFGFGLSLLLSVHLLSKHFKQMSVNTDAKEKKNSGISRCLIISGCITVIIWLVMLIPHLIIENYGDLLDILTTEAAYALDLGVLCPLMIICGMWIRKKNDIGYKVAPILLYILFSVAPMVIFQNLYCMILGIIVPLPAFIGMVLSFLVMGTFAIICLKKSTSLLRE